MDFFNMLEIKEVVQWIEKDLLTQKVRLVMLVIFNYSLLILI